MKRNFLLVFIGIIIAVLIGLSVFLLIYKSSPSEKDQVLTPGSCKLLPEKYCFQGKLVQWTDAHGKKWTGIGFNLPAGVALFSPMKGQVSKGHFVQSDEYKGYKALIFNPNNPVESYSFVGDITMPNMDTINVSPGTKIGETADSGIKNFNKYNLVIIIVEINPATKKDDSTSKLKTIFKDVK